MTGADWVWSRIYQDGVNDWRWLNIIMTTPTSMADADRLLYLHYIYMEHNVFC